MGEYVIGIDAGGTMTKAALFDLKGRELACARSRNVMIFSNPGWTERDPETMWSAATQSVSDVIAKAGVSPSAVAGLGVSGYGGGLYLLDENGKSVRPGIVSTDSRAAELLSSWNEDGRGPKIEKLIGQKIWTGQSLILLAWLKKYEPEALERTHKISFCKDFIRTQLCGDFSTDPTDAGSAGLIDQQSGTYCEEALELAGLSFLRDKLPEIHPSNKVAGQINEYASQLTSLPAGTPVVRGMVDMSAAATASNIQNPTEMSVVAGTFSISATLHKTPRAAIIPMLQFPYPLGGFLAVEAAPTSASNLEWVVKTMLAHGEDLGEDELNEIYAKVNAAMARKIGNPSDVIFLPYLFGGPGGAQAGFMGMTAQTEFDDVMMAVFEGIIFAHKNDVDMSFTGTDAAPVETIRLTGGATRSAKWSEMFAHVLDRPVEVPNGSEFGALGVAICTANAIGAYDTLPDAINKMTSIRDRYEVNSEIGEKHRRKYPQFRALSEAMAQFAGSGPAWAIKREVEAVNA